MNTREKTVIFLIIIAVILGFSLSFLPNNVDWAVAEDVSSTLSYAYIMDDPLAVAADGEKLYALDSDGNVIEVGSTLTVVETRAGAKKLAVSGGRIVTDSADDCVAVFCGNYSGEITPLAIYIGEGDSRTVAAVPDEGFVFESGALDGNVLYAAARKHNGTAALFAYDFSDNNSKTLIKNEITTDNAEIVAMTVSAGKIRYATSYSLFTVGSSRGEHIGGIQSLTAGGENLYFTTRSGEICAYDGQRTDTLLAAAEKVTVATRKNFAVFTDKGNNLLTLFRDGATLTAQTERPTSAAIDYAGNIYVASENKVMTFTRGLEYVGEESDMLFGGADENIAEIATDPSDVTGCTLYALSDNGTLRRNTDDNTASGLKSVEISADGVVYGMRDDGSVVKFSSDLSSETQVLPDGEFVAFTLDRGDHVYRATADAIFRDNETQPIFVGSGITEIAVSAVTLASPNFVTYGDMIVISDDGCSSVVLPRASAGTDMRDDETDEKYTEFLIAADGAATETTDHSPDLRRAETVSDVYMFPAETPVGGNKEIEVGAYVIIIAKYYDSAYYYAIAETKNGSVKGFVNGNTLSDALPLDAEYDSNACAPIMSASIYKYPSPAAEVVGEATLGTPYAILPFVASYRDSAGREWLRVAFGNGSGGYILRSNVAVNGHTGGYNKDMYTDAIIKSNEDSVTTYIDSEGKFELGTIADGTPVKLEETFNKSLEFIKITYVSDTETGATTTCYVRTEFVKHTESGWYQVIFFIVGGVVIVAIAVIIFVMIRKKRRID